MYDGKKIIVGLLVFIAIASIPWWYSRAAGESYSPPDIKLPKGECVESRDYMRSSHMQLLDEWRDSVVRLGNREHVSKSGKKFKMSLTGTCLACHGEAAEPGQSAADSFCLKCHQKTGVSVTCWDCHHETEDETATAKPAVEKPVMKRPAVRKPAVKKPAVKKPAVKKPAPATKGGAR